MTVKENLISSAEQPKPWVQTPLMEAFALSQAAGWYGLTTPVNSSFFVFPITHQVFLKLENLQPSGSFKSRGIGYYILRRLEELPSNVTHPHVFCSSGGNAGLAAVHASRSFGVPCTVVVPMTTKPMMIAKLRAAGAYDVIQYGTALRDADAYMKEVVMPEAGPAGIYTPPFDHPDIWCGNSTVMEEIATQVPGGDPDAVICSVGGGGLLNGVCQVLDSLNMTSTAVVALETQGAESLNAALSAGELVTLNKISSQATSLGCVRVTQQTLDYAQRGSVRSVVLPDAEAAMGCWRLADDERIMVELACGVNVALCYDGRLDKALGRKVRPDDKVVIVLCGGSNVTVEQLGQWRKEYAYLEDSTRRDSALDLEVKQMGSVVPSEVSAPLVLNHEREEHRLAEAKAMAKARVDALTSGCGSGFVNGCSGSQWLRNH